MTVQLGPPTLGTKCWGQTACSTCTWQGQHCQPFSEMGKNKGRPDERSETLRDVGCFIVERKPKTFILEQVPNIKCKTHKSILNNIIKKLRSIACLPRKGLKPKRLYKLHQRTLNSQDFGSATDMEEVLCGGHAKWNWTQLQTIHNASVKFKMPACRANHPSCCTFDFNSPSSQ